MLFKFQRAKCTAETTGTVIRKRWNGDVWFLKVEYTVDGETYLFSEQLRYRKVKTHKVMGLPVGMRSTAPMGDVEEGDTVLVRYDPSKPKRAYLPDNEGLPLA